MEVDKLPLMLKVFHETVNANKEPLFVRVLIEFLNSPFSMETLHAGVECHEGE